MHKIAQKLLAVATVVATIFSFGVPSFAASSSYHFELNYRIVDGKDNGQFHTLNKGTVYIKGEHFDYNYDPGALKNPYDVSYSLLRDRFGPDAKCGTATFDHFEDPSGKLGVADKDSSKYYLQVWKGEDDGYNMRGSGEIYN